MSDPIARLEARVRALEARLAVSGEVRVSRQVRLAVTCDPSGSGVSYPTTGAVMPIKFIDGTFTETVGDQTLTTTERSAEQLAVAYSLSGDTVAVGTVVSVFFYNGRWWLDQASGYNACSFILRTDLDAGSSAIAEKTIYRESEDECGPYDPTLQYRLCFCEPRTFFRVFDRLGEFAGTADLHCGIAHRLADTPADPAKLCFTSGAPASVNGNAWQEDWEWDNRPWEIQRLVCANFLDCGCQDFWNDPCTAEVETYP